MTEENLRNIFNPSAGPVVLKSIKSWAQSNAWRRSFGAVDLSNKLRILSEFPIGSSGSTKSYRLLTCRLPTNSIETNLAGQNLNSAQNSERLPPSKCLYLEFTFSPLPSAQFEIKESPALIRISLKASKREKGLDERFTKIKFQLLSFKLRSSQGIFRIYSL